MNQPPPKSPPPAPAAPAAPRQDTLETANRNKFGVGNRPTFAPTPIKRNSPLGTTGEVSTGGLRPPPARVGAPTGPRPSPAPSSQRPAIPGKPTGPDFAMPGAGASIENGTATPGVASGGAAKPTTPVRPGQRTSTAPMQAAVPAVATTPKAPAAKPAGLITTGDVLGYQGKLPVYVGKAADGNPMVDAEDARFTFEPREGRIQLECRLASIMLKAACLHLGIPAPERGPRKFNLTAFLRRDVILKHQAKLFDGNLEVRLSAVTEGRPVLLDLTLYEDLHVAPAT